MPDGSYEITGLILAGGASRRMGRPKPGLELGGETLLGRVLSQVRPLCREIILVTRRPSDFLEFGERTVRDLLPGQGPLGGLATGLFYARHRLCLTLACDLPFLNPAILRLVIETAQAGPRGARVTAPRTSDGWQPLVAVYSRECLKPAMELLAEGGHKVGELMHKGVHWHAVPENILRTAEEDLRSFVNVNTPEDLARAEAEIEA